MICSVDEYISGIIHLGSLPLFENQDSDIRINRYLFITHHFSNAASLLRFNSNWLQIFLKCQIPSYSKQIFNLFEYKSREIPKLSNTIRPPYVHSSSGKWVIKKSRTILSPFDVNLCSYFVDVSNGEHPNLLKYSFLSFCLKYSAYYLRVFETR